MCCLHLLYRGVQHLKRVRASWEHYSQCFEQWKRHDQVKLEDIFIAHAIELEALRMSVQGNEATEREWYTSEMFVLLLLPML